MIPYMNRVIPSAKARNKRTCRKYRARNRKILNKKRMEKYAEKRLVIIKHGTEKDAKHYGCLKEWRRCRGLPTDARILPKPGHTGRVDRSKRGIVTMATIKKGYVSFDKWKRTYLQRVSITSPTLRAHKTATRRVQRARKNDVVNK